MVFLAEKPPNIWSYGVKIRFWPTLLIYDGQPLTYHIPHYVPPCSLHTTLSSPHRQTSRNFNKTRRLVFLLLTEPPPGQRPACVAHSTQHVTPYFSVTRNVCSASQVTCVTHSKLHVTIFISITRNVCSASQANLRRTLHTARDYLSSLLRAALPPRHRQAHLHTVQASCQGMRCD